jgi:competence protein ComEC
MARGGRAQESARAIDVARPRGIAWPSLSLPSLSGAREHLQRWLVSDAASGRLMPWLPIAFGVGVVVYFTAAREPILWIAPSVTAVLAVAAIVARARPLVFPLLLALTTAAAGFAVVSLKSARIVHPILQRNAWNIQITGFVEMREERERTDRITVRVYGIEGKLDEALERVRLSVRKTTAPPVGAFIAVKTRLNPPLRPLRPGGYDFSRDLYFQRIGATGFVLGEIKTVDPPAQPGFSLRYATVIESIRDRIDARIRAVLPGDAGSIASALLTGKRDAISAPVNEAMYISSLAHVLSISGYHMAVVAGVVFFIVRALLALSSTLALRYPIKKWAAGVALVATFLYLLLSGVEVAAQRSFIMTGIVLIGVMVDRAALTLRNLALAALGVMLVAPEAVVHPSFQMSFAATLALIAGYERGLPWMTAGADTPLGARIALWGGREIVGLILASMLAGLATTPYAAFHFHRLAPYGVISNLLAMPVVSALVMPAGMLALLFMPFGLDGWLWTLMGEGIEWMIWVVLFVAKLPGAVGRVTAFGTGPLLLMSAGIVLVCLLRSPLRWSGVALGLLGTLWAVRTPLPDVYVADRGDMVAVRNASGTLAVMRLQNSDAFSVKEWLGADADERTPKDKSLHDGVACDEIGCIARLADGTIVALPFAAESFAEDCRRAALIVSQRTAPPGCAAPAIDRTVWPRTGASVLYRTLKGWETVVVHPAGYDRPWSRTVPATAAPATAAAPSMGAAPSAAAPSSPAPGEATPTNATPSPELQADD